jgi:hypothetical protein
MNEELVMIIIKAFSKAHEILTGRLPLAMQGVSKCFKTFFVIPFYMQSVLVSSVNCVKNFFEYFIQ